MEAMAMTNDDGMREAQAAHERDGMAPGSRLRFMVAGHAKCTIRSRATGQRYTFAITAPRKEGSTAIDHEARVRFVKVLTGPDNGSDYRYLGTLWRDARGWTFRHGGAKAKIAADAPSAKAFAWFALHPESEQVEFFHSGACGRCGRELTVPESIESGFGPVCAGRD